MGPPSCLFGDLMRPPPACWLRLQRTPLGQQPCARARTALRPCRPASARAQGLGYGILAGSTLVKVPQLLNVVRAHSAEGLNPISFELETLGLLIATTYGFLMCLPFSAFGEVVVSAQWERGGQTSWEQQRAGLGGGGWGGGWDNA